MSYKGGRTKSQGYWYVWMPNHPYAQKKGYIAEHRLVMEKMIGRFLRPEECIDHIDHNTENNDPSNLRLFSTHGQHTKIAHPEAHLKGAEATKGKKPPNYARVENSCRVCGNKFFAHPNRKRLFCSIPCYRKSRKGKPNKNIEGLKLGRGWNRGIRCDWQLKGKDSPHFKHGRYSKYLQRDLPQGL